MYKYDCAICQCHIDYSLRFQNIRMVERNKVNNLLKHEYIFKKNHFIKNERVVSNIMFFGINNGNHYI